jgi:hypothetical protein
MRHCFPILILTALSLAGCAEPPEPPRFQQGDMVRPHLVVSRKGEKATITMSLEQHRAGRDEPSLLLESDVPHQDVVMRARVTLFAGNSQLGEPQVVPFKRDC